MSLNYNNCHPYAIIIHSNESGRGKYYKYMCIETVYLYDNYYNKIYSSTLWDNSISWIEYDAWCKRYTNSIQIPHLRTSL